MNNSSNSSTSFIPGHTDSSSQHDDFIWFAVLIVVGCLIVVVNFITIVTFVMNRHLRRRSVLCLLHLAVVDMLFGGASIINQTLDTDAVVFFFSFLLVCSLSALTLVSVERVYAIFFPFRHRTTRLRMYIVAFTIAWIIPVPELITVITYTWSSTDELTVNDIFFLAVYPTCLLLISTSYTAIFIQVKKQAKRLQTNQQQTAVIRIRQKREHHLAMTLLIVTVVSLIAWLPYTSVIIRTFVVTTSDEFYYSTTFHMTLLIQNINSLINPIIYVFRMRDFRRALLRLVLKCSRDQQIHPIGHHGNQNRHNEAGLQLQVMQQM